jgi:VanZ family protein
VKRAAWAFFPALAYAGLIFYLSSRSDPLPFLPPAFFQQDKLLHAAEYAVLGALLVPALRLAGVRPRLALLGAVLLASAFGASDEIHQSYVPARSADAADWAADTVGAAIGASLAAAFLRRPRGAG